MAERLLGQRKDTPLGPGHPLAERPVVLAVPCEADGRAQVGVAFEAERALVARDRRIHRDSPAVLRVVPASSWPGSQRAGEGHSADGALGEPVQVRPAQPRGLDPDQNLPGARCRAGARRGAGHPPARGAWRPSPVTDLSSLPILYLPDCRSRMTRSRLHEGGEAPTSRPRRHRKASWSSRYRT